MISNADCREEFDGAITGNNICTMTPYVPPQGENATTVPPPRRRLGILKESNVTNEQPEEGAEAVTEVPAEAETLPPPDYVSPCLVSLCLMIG